MTNIEPARPARTVPDRVAASAVRVLQSAPPAPVTTTFIDLTGPRSRASAEFAYDIAHTWRCLE